MENETSNEVSIDEPVMPGSLLDRMNEVAKPRPRPEPLPRSPSGRNSLANEDTATVADWLKGFSGNQVRITLVRVYPEYFQGRDVSGVLDHYDELIDEEYIKSRYGGGKYQIKAQTIQDNGQWRYAGARTIKIAGDPKITGDIFSRDTDKEEIVVPQESNSLSERAMAMTERMLQEERARADRVERSAVPQGINENMVALMIRPYETQIQVLSAQLAAKEQQIVDKDRTIKELSNLRPDTSRSDNLLEKVISNESSKLDALRMQFDSERRMLMDSHKDEVKRVLDRHDYEMKSKDDSLNREVKNLERSFDAQVTSLKSGFESRLESKDNRIKDLERQLTRLEAELGELKARKEKSAIENMKDIAEFKEMADQFMGGGKDEEEEISTFERVASKVMDSPLVQAIGARVVNGPAAPPPPRATQPRKRIAPAAPTAEQVAANPLAGVDPASITGAVGYMESAVANGVDPAIFSQAIRSQAPPSLLTAIQKMGVDSFLDSLGLSDASPLATQVGRNWARKVVKALQVGVDPAPSNGVPEAVEDPTEDGDDNS